MNIKCFAIITAAALGALLATAASASAGEVSGIGNGRGRVSITPLEGCDASRPAVAHGTDRIPVSVQPAYAPIPCQSVIGLSSEDADVGVTRSGALFYAPLVQNTSPPPQNTLEGPENVVRSDNGGASWIVLDSGGPTTGGLVPPWMGVDRETERIWFATTFASLCGARISWSDDEGNRWQTNPSVGCPAEGANKVLEGPPPRGGARPVHYPHVVYYCANSNDAGGIVYCYRSLDGGKTFSFVGNPDPELPSGCVETHPARTGVVGPDGVLYFPTQLCDASGAPNSVLGIAISRDEGATLDPTDDRRHSDPEHLHPVDRRRCRRQSLHCLDRPEHSALSDDLSRPRQHLEHTDPACRSRYHAGAHRGHRCPKAGGDRARVPRNHRRYELQRVHHLYRGRLGQEAPLLECDSERPCRTACQWFKQPNVRGPHLISHRCDRAGRQCLGRVPLCRDSRLPRPATRRDGAVGAEPLQEEIRSPCESHAS